MKNLIEIYRSIETIVNGRPNYDFKLHAQTSGVIDMLAGGISLKTMKVVEDSTHILICGMADIEIGDYITCDKNKNRVYEVTYVDNPMNRNHHLEVELKYLPDITIEE